MSMKLRVAVAKSWFPVFDGTDGGDPDPGKAPETKTPPDTKTPEEKLFTQKDLDEKLNKRFAKEKTEKERLVAELKGLKESKGLTESEKEQLATRIAEMEDSMLTKEQLAAQERANLEKKFATDVKKYQTESETWKNKFVDSTLIRSITDAGVTAGAEDPSQLVMMFRGASRLEPVKDESGKETGDYIARIKFVGKDEEGKPLNMDLPIGEAFQKMREMKLHTNLWKHNANPGTGQGAGSGQGSGGDPSKMPDRDNFPNDAAWRVAYDTWRDNYNLDGSPVKKK